MIKLSDRILVNNHQFIAINKPGGTPVQPDPTGDSALTNWAESYCKTPIFLVHRLDRPTSGIVLMAKNKTALEGLNEQFRDRSIRKSYLAITANKPDPESGELNQFLKKTATDKVKIADEEIPGSQPVSLSYKLLASSDNYHLLEITPVTGRLHQIRAQLASIGCPIKGDVKYGARRNNEDRSIHLHAWKLSLKHPISGEAISLKADLPEDALWQFFGESLMR